MAARHGLGKNQIHMSLEKRNVYRLLLHLGSAAEYCDELGCSYVYLSADISYEPRA